VGHATYEITSATGTTLVIDPWYTESSVATTGLPDKADTMHRSPLTAARSTRRCAPSGKEGDMHFRIQLVIADDDGHEHRQEIADLTRTEASLKTLRS